MGIFGAVLGARAVHAHSLNPFRISTQRESRNARLLEILILSSAGLFASVAHADTSLPSVASNTPPLMVLPGQPAVGNTGAFSYSIPIAIPPGTAGMKPSLSLSYSTQNQNGFEGLGWTLTGLPMIERCQDTIAEDGFARAVNYSSSDNFCMNGQRLVPISGTNGADGTEYRTEVQSYSRIISYGSAGSGPAYFMVWTKSGQTMELGNTTDSQVLAVGSSSARAWAVDKVSDRVGNFFTVTYNGASSADRTANGEVYPVRVDYTGNGSNQPYNSVRFVYGSRADQVPTYEAGSLVETTKLLTDIQTYNNPSSVIYDYHLSYRPGTTLVRSRLTSLTLCDASGTHCLAPTTFGWQGGSSTLSYTTQSGISDLAVRYQTESEPYPPGVYLIPELVPADVDGDGITDVVAVRPAQSCSNDNGPTAIYIGQGDGTFAPSSSPVCLGNSGLLPTLSVDGASAVDVEGDGFSDFVVVDTLTNPLSGNQTYITYLMQNNKDGTFKTTALSSDASLNVLGDFNGDGIFDYLNVDLNPVYPVLGDGKGGFNKDTNRGAMANDMLGGYAGDFDGAGCTDSLNGNAAYLYCAAGSQPSIPFTYPNCGSGLTKPVLGDFNGDGKTDVLVVCSSVQGSLQLSTGKGFVDSGFTVPSDWAKYVIVVGDWNGDGKADIALFAGGGNTTFNYGLGQPHAVWLSTGSGFVQAFTITNNNSTDYANTSEPSVSAVAADWNSDGAADIWLQKRSGDVEYLFTYVPELMTSVSNGLGATTTISYDRLNKNGSFYAKGSSAAYPTTDLDGAYYVVSRVDASNGLGTCAPPTMTNCYSVTYSYAGAQKDLQGRGFLGFQSVISTDLQTNLVQTTNYSTSFPFVGMVLSQTKVCPKPTCVSGQNITLSSATYTYSGDTSCSSAKPTGPVYTPLLCEIVTAAKDTDGSPLPSVETDYSNYDAYGNAATVTVKTSPSAGANPDVVKVSSNTYVNTVNATTWILGQLKDTTVETTRGTSDITRESSFTYYSGTGLLHTEVMEPEAAGTSNLKLTTTYTYDAFGNRYTKNVAGSGNPAPAACLSTVQYDSHGEFPQTTTNCESENEGWQYDVRFGTPTSYQDANPSVPPTTWLYDPLGRLSIETMSDGTTVQSTYQYCTSVPGGTDSTCPVNATFSVDTASRGTDGTTQTAPDTRIYYDMLSRVVDRYAQPFSGSNWIRVVTGYDANERVLRTSRPYFNSVQTPAYTTFAYDPLDRVITATAPDNVSNTQTAYHGLSTTVTVHDVLPDGSSVDEPTTTVKNDLGLVDSILDAKSQTTSYSYDALGELIGTVDPSGNASDETYDVRGRKICGSDPDMAAGSCVNNTGTPWRYGYNSLSELTSQTDAKGQTVTMQYDVLGRMVSRAEPDMTSSWTYGSNGTTNNQGTYPNSVDKLVAASCTGTACGGSYTRTYAYDSLSRQSTLTLAIASLAHHKTTIAYDPVSGKFASVQNFSGFTIDYNYSSRGYLSTITDDSTGALYWKVNSQDAELHVTQETAGNGVVTQRVYDPNFGFVDAVTAGASAGDTSIANFTYSWDSLGNLASRTDMLAVSGGQTENFCYDTLNRLTYSSIATSGSSACNSGGDVHVQYDPSGNITSKTGVGSYSYSGYGPHAVSYVNTPSGKTLDGVHNPNFTYDANGNMLCVLASGQTCAPGSAARLVSYTSFNMTSAVLQGTSNTSLFYDPEHNRIMQNAAAGSGTTNTVYWNDAYANVMNERVQTNGGAYTWNSYIKVGDRLVALRSTTQSSVNMEYFVTDQLGSVAVATDGNSGDTNYGQVITGGRLFYDPWGAMRNNDGSTDTTCSLPPQAQSNTATTRGFTAQEQMPAFCLINYNARLYDPALGRFVTPDSIVPDPFDGQSFNRYAYVRNRPLSVTDPDGHDDPGGDGGRDIVVWGDTSSIPADPTVMSISGDGWAKGATSGGGGSPLMSCGATNTAVSPTGQTLAQQNGVTLAPPPTPNTASGAAAATNVAPGSSATHDSDGGKTDSAKHAGSNSGDSQNKVEEITVIGKRIPHQSLSYRTVSGAPGTKHWQIRWHLAIETAQGGFVIQRIHIVSKKTDANGKVTITEDDFTEAWRISQGGQETTNKGHDDDFAFKDGKSGADYSTTVDSSAQFYEDLDELPSDFIRNNPATFGGDVPSTKTAHDFPQATTDPVNRTDTYNSNNIGH